MILPSPNPPMNPRRSFRLLYLLALLHLAGGPLVVLGVLSLGKIVVTHAVERGFGEGLVVAFQSEEWGVACLALAEDGAPLPGSERPAPEPKGKDLNAKFHSIVSSSAPISVPQAVAGDPLWADRRLKAFDRAHAPPSPPPRAA